MTEILFYFGTFQSSQTDDDQANSAGSLYKGSECNRHQCDQMATLFFQNLGIFNNEILPFT